MRPLLCAVVVLASGLVVGVVAPGGVASPSTVGDGCLVVQDGFGRVTVSLTRGIVFGRFQQGLLKVANPVPTDISSTGKGVVSPVKVFPAVPTKVTERWTTYSGEQVGEQVRFRTSGPVKIVVDAQGTDLSVVGKGLAILGANDQVGSATPKFSGTFSVDAASFCQDNFQEMPAVQKRFPIATPLTAPSTS
jgi:hypothetical protein